MTMLMYTSSTIVPTALPQLAIKTGSGTVAMNVLERRLEATESVVELSKAKEVGV